MRKHSSWEQRISRVEDLFNRYPFAQEVLRFYREVLLFQKEVYHHLAPLGEKASSSGARPPLRVDLLLPLFPQFLALITEIAPPPLASTAGDLALQPKEAWEVLLRTFWEEGKLSGGEGAVPLLFFPKAFLQPYGERLAEGWKRPEGRKGTPSCPFCGGRPQVGALKGVGEGAELFLVCSRCAIEWPFERIVCPACGERDPKRLAYYQAEEFPHIRLSACEACKRYLKSVDLTREGRAVPVVDELASIPLDLWAKERGYQKLEPNLAGL